jgi:hypothetical protein
MGVTIHYEGRLKSEDCYKQLIRVSVDFATENKMTFEQFALPQKRLERVANEEDWNYDGPVKGIKILPSENCEPLLLEFDENLIVQDFSKTQFAGSMVHIQVVTLLDLVSNLFDTFTVIDEGEYWETRNAGRLQELLDESFKLIQTAKDGDETLSGPFRLEDGRIVDLMRQS